MKAEEKKIAAEGNKITIQDFRKLNIVNWLKSLGFKPTEINEKEAKYKSFFRNKEQSATLIVNRKLQVFIDITDSKFAGDIVKLGCLMFKTDEPGLLKYLNNDSFFFLTPHFSSVDEPKETSNIFLMIEDIVKPELISFVNKKGISLDIAQKYLKQLTVEIKGQKYDVFGFQSQLQEWEFYFPNNVCKDYKAKSFSLISNQSSTVCLFTDIFDLLSFIQLNADLAEFDLISLNSMSLLPSLMPLLIYYKKVLTYFKKDKQGNNANGILLGMGLSLTNKSNEIQEKDLNTHLIVKRYKLKDENKNINVDEVFYRHNRGIIL